MKEKIISIKHTKTSIESNLIDNNLKKKKKLQNYIHIYKIDFRSLYNMNL